MSQVYVIRKEFTPAVPIGGSMPGGMQMMYSPSQEAQTQQFAGVTGGIDDLNIHPVTQQYEAKPVMSEPDNEGKRTELGYHVGDATASAALNQMNRREMREGEGRASGVSGDTYQRGRLNPARYKGVGQGLKTIGEKTRNIPVIGRMTRPLREMNTDNFGQDTGMSAGQVAFDRGSKFGEMAHNLGGRMGTTVGVLAGLTQLANAGAAGQDAFTGGVGAYQTGQVTADSMKKPLAEGLGGATANVAGRSVGVTRPEVAEPTPTPTPQVAPPTRGQVMVEGLKPGSKVAIDSEEARNRALRDIYNPSDAAQSLGHYGADAESRLRETQEQASNLIGVTGNPLQMPSSPNPINNGQPYLRLDNVDGEPMQTPPATASPTPQTPMSEKQVGSIIANNTTGNTTGKVEDAQAGQTIKDAEEAAKATDTDASMASASSTNVKKMLVGVV